MVRRIWSAAVKDIGDRIILLSMTEAVELSQYLENVHGLRATVERVAVTDRQPTPEPKPLPQPTAYEVVLERFEPSRKILVIKAVRELTGQGLKEAKDLVEAAPRVVRTGLPAAEAEQVQAHLEAAGAKTTIKGIF
jgi:large subunit ribosomal protein L7/L12